VGGEYSPDTNRYDHHQRTFTTTFPSHETKLSSAGLVYMHFGQAIISERPGLPKDSPALNLIYQKLYDDFIEALDANDNGISAYDTSALSNAGIQKRFKDGGVTLGSLVSDLNYAPTAPVIPTEIKDSKVASQAEEDARFLSASTLMGDAFLRKLSHCHLSWLPARDIVQKAFQSRKVVHPSGRIMRIEAGMPWKEHLYSLEEADKTITEENNVLYVLYPESEAEDSRWRVQCVSKEQGGFENRKGLPEKWRGVRDQELDKVIGGLEGAVFVHASGFIGGHLKEEGAKEMAVKALEME
jgi:uncharacterized UPF0160 family protein